MQVHIKTEIYTLIPLGSLGFHKTILHGFAVTVNKRRTDLAVVPQVINIFKTVANRTFASVTGIVVNRIHKQNALGGIPNP